MPEPKGRRPRGQFDEEFPAQAVRLVLDDEKTVGAVARDLDHALGSGFLGGARLHRALERQTFDRPEHAGTRDQR